MRALDLAELNWYTGSRAAMRLGPTPARMAMRPDSELKDIVGSLFGWEPPPANGKPHCLGTLRILASCNFSATTPAGNRQVDAKGSGREDRLAVDSFERRGAVACGWHSSELHLREHPSVDAR